MVEKLQNLPDELLDVIASNIMDCEVLNHWRTADKNLLEWLRTLGKHHIDRVCMTVVFSNHEKIYLPKYVSSVKKLHDIFWKEPRVISWLKSNPDEKWPLNIYKLNIPGSNFVKTNADVIQTLDEHAFSDMNQNSLSILCTESLKYFHVNYAYNDALVFSDGEYNENMTRIQGILEKTSEDQGWKRMQSVLNGDSNETFFDLDRETLTMLLDRWQYAHLRNVVVRFLHKSVLMDGHQVNKNEFQHCKDLIFERLDSFSEEWKPHVHEREENVMDIFEKKTVAALVEYISNLHLSQKIWLSF